MRKETGVRQKDAHGLGKVQGNLRCTGPATHGQQRWLALAAELIKARFSIAEEHARQGNRRRAWFPRQRPLLPNLSSALWPAPVADEAFASQEGWRTLRERERERERVTAGASVAVLQQNVAFLQQWGLCEIPLGGKNRLC
jgi:hypothetical protein